MYCSQCGAWVPDGQRFCGDCGAAMDSPERTVVLEEPKAATDGVQGFISASERLESSERRRPDAIPVLAAIAGLAAMLVVVLLLANRFGMPSFSGLFSWREQLSDPAPVEAPAPVAQEQGDEADTEEAPEADDALYGRTASVGNLINGGYVTGDEGWVYYAIPAQAGDWHTSSIGKMREDGTEKQVIYTASGSDVYVWHMVVEGGRLYFVEENEAGTRADLVSVALDGSDRMVITGCMPETPVMLSEGTIYVTDGTYIVSYVPKTSTLARLSDGPSSEDLWRVRQGRIYWFEKGGRTVFSSSLEGTSLVAGVAANLQQGQALVNVQPADDGLWLLVDADGDGRGDEVMRAGLDGSGLAYYAQASGYATRINAGDDGVFLVVYDSSSTRIELATEGNGRPVSYYTTSADADARHPMIYGGYLYFGVHGDPDRLMRVPLSAPGATPEVVV